MLSVTKKPFVLSVVMLIVVMLRVVAPFARASVTKKEFYKIGTS